MPSALKNISEPDSDLLLQWEKVSLDLIKEFGDAAFKSWLKPLVVLGFQQRKLILAAPSRFMRDWVNAHYANRICKIWMSMNPNIDSIDIIIKAPIAATAERKSPQQLKHLLNLKT